MYEPSEKMKSIEQQFLSVPDGEVWKGVENKGSAGWYLSKAYEIHKNRQDSISEAVCIEAFNNRVFEPLRNWVPREIEEWVENDLNNDLDRDTFPMHMSARPWKSDSEGRVFARVGLDRDTFPMHMSARPWKSDSEGRVFARVGGANKDADRRVVARCVDESDYLFFSGLIGHVPDLVRGLANAQDALMEQMNLILKRVDPLSSELARKSRIIDELLSNLGPESEGLEPWRYDPDTFLISGSQTDGQQVPIAYLANSESTAFCGRIE